MSACFCLQNLTSICLKEFQMSFAKYFWGNLVSFRINPLPFLPVSFCQCLLWVIYWCLSELNSRVFLPVSFSEFNWCLSEVSPNVLCQFCLEGSLDVFLDQPKIFLANVCCSASVCYEEPADLCLDWTRVSTLPMSFSEFNRCLLEVFPNVFCQICLKGSLDVFPDQPNIFLASVCLMGLISVCLSWFSPVSFCQCLLWGTCWCLSGLNSRVFLPVSF